MKAMPTCSRHRPSCSGDSSRRTPSSAENVGAAGPARHRAIPVFGHWHSGGCSDQSGGGGDVERPLGVPAGAAGVDDAVQLMGNRHEAAAHGGGGAGNLSRRLALARQSDEQGGLVHLAQATVHQLAKELLDLGALRDRRHRSNVAGSRRHPLRHAPRYRSSAPLPTLMKLLSSLTPSGVKIDSGWNCTPQ